MKKQQSQGEDAIADLSITFDSGDSETPASEIIHTESSCETYSLPFKNIPEGVPNTASLFDSHQSIVMLRADLSIGS